MQSFEHVNADTIEDAISLLDSDWNARIIAGGTDLLGEMKRKIISPKRLVNLKTVEDLSCIRYSEEGGLKIGALAALSDVERDDAVRAKFGILSQAISKIGSPQLRNMGTIGGNLCQRPRCWYYRNAHYHCLRKGGRGCLAVTGKNKYHAILGGGPCFIVHPSDLAPALIALDATLEIASSTGRRTIPVEEFFVGPKIFSDRENILTSNEVVTEIQVPNLEENSREIYLKAMERKAWDFATVSVAAQLTFDDGIVNNARIVLGGVAPTPWRTQNAERVLHGKKIDEKIAEQAADIALANSRPLKDNAYKVELAKALVERALLMLIRG